MIRPCLSGRVNGQPVTPAYQYRARAYPAARAAIARAEAAYGPPVPTCLYCGGQCDFTGRSVNGRCRNCGQPASAPETAAR